MSNRIIEKLQNIFRKKEDEIELDIEKLPDKIGKYKVIMQYTPPKGLSPSEVGFLYYRKFQDSNLDAMLYEWAYKGNVSITNSVDKIIITRLKTLNSNKLYEQKCWNLLFGGKEGQKQIMYFKNESFDLDYQNIEITLADYCYEQGWLDYDLKKVVIGRIPVPIGLFNFINSVLIFYIGVFSLGFLATIFNNDFCTWLVFGSMGLFSIIFLYNSIVEIGYFFSSESKKKIKSIRLKDEGEKLLAHIYGYKYYLEKCEEEQFKKLMEEDPTFLDKTLPYIIALRLNWYFLKNQSILHRKDMSITTISK